MGAVCPQNNRAGFKLHRAKIQKNWAEVIVPLQAEKSSSSLKGFGSTIELKLFAGSMKRIN